MPISSAPISDMTVTVKSREVQRAMLAEMRGDRPEATRHFLAAAHLELVLAADYEQAGDKTAAARGRLSAASCFWRAGVIEQARRLFTELAQADPAVEAEVKSVQDDLERTCPRQDPDAQPG